MISSFEENFLLFPENDLRILEGSPVRGQQSLGLFVSNEWNYAWPLKGATCHLFFERQFNALVYHPPVAQIVIYHSRHVIWNLFAHDLLNADVPPRGIKRIAYANADQRAESLTITSSTSCFIGDVHHCLDGVNCGPAFSKDELVFRQTVLFDHVTL